MSDIGNDNRMLYTRLRFEEVTEGHILLRPCEEGDCDGPWHESVVLRRNGHVTTVDDGGRLEVWDRPAHEIMCVLSPSRRPQHRSRIGDELLTRLPQG